MEATQKERRIRHIARESTAIPAREGFAEAQRAEEKKSGRSASRSAPRAASPTPKLRIEVRASSASANRSCRRSPISAILTSASLRDSQVAIGLMTMTSQGVTHQYELMDSAYDANPIHEQSGN